MTTSRYSLVLPPSIRRRVERLRRRHAHLRSLASAMIFVLEAGLEVLEADQG